MVKKQVLAILNGDDVMEETRRVQRKYLIGAVIVWIALVAATSVILAGTPYFSQMLTIVAGGAVYFVVLVPAWLFR